MRDRVKLLVTYLSLGEPPSRNTLASRPSGCVCEVRVLDYDAYIALYRVVGGPWGWDQRLNMARTSLARFLAGPDCEIYGLSDETQGPDLIGFAEFDCADTPTIQLVNFGLVPAAFGRRCGGWFLREALVRNWRSRRPSRVWLHTDTGDHPAALATYMRAGFKRDFERWQDASEL